MRDKINMKKMKIEEIEKIPVEELKKFKNSVKKLVDYRVKKRCTYKLWDVIVVGILSTFAEGNDWIDMKIFGLAHKKWLRTFLQLTGGIPSAQTFERIFSIVDSDELNKICVEFINKITKKPINDKLEKDILCLDGKVDRKSKREETSINEGIKALNVLSAYSNKLSMSIGQRVIGDKTNEIPEMPKLLKSLDLTNAICTWDALNTQKKTVETVIDRGGEYVAALKGNHSNFEEDVKMYFDEECIDIIKTGYKGSYHIEKEKSHSKLITYEIFQTEDVKWYSEFKEWKGLKSFILIRKTIENMYTSKRKNKKTKIVEERTYISSLLLDAKKAGNIARTHWSVENKLHWQLDFTFKTDDNTTINKKALFNLQIVKKFVLGILTKVKPEYNLSLQKIRKTIVQNAEEELEILFKKLRKYI